MVLFIKETKGLTLSEILPNRIPISQYLQHIDLYHLVRYLEENCYEGGGNHFHHDPLIMLKLVVVKLFRKLSYRD